MSTYKGKPVTVEATSQAIADKFADLTVLQNTVENLPEEQRKQLGNTRFEKDAIIINTPQAGEMRFQVVERSNQAVKMQAGGMLPMELNIALEEVDATHTQVTTTINVELPMMLRPFVGPYMQKAADHFGALMAGIVKPTDSNDD